MHKSLVGTKISYASVFLVEYVPDFRTSALRMLQPLVVRPGCTTAIAQQAKIGSLIGVHSVGNKKTVLDCTQLECLDTELFLSFSLHLSHIRNKIIYIYIICVFVVG